MARYLLRRLAFSVAVLVVSSLVIFSALYAAPGDPLTALAAGRPLPAEAKAALTAEYRLDDPFLVRYGHWVGGVVRGDFGRSYVAQGQDVRSLLAGRIGTTALLVAMASLLIIVGGIAIGTIAAMKKGVLGAALRLGAVVGLAVPSFVAAMVLITVFAVGLGWFPVFGTGDGLLDRLWHLTLPAIALALSALAYVARITEASVDEELVREHVMTARARGLPPSAILRRHVLRNAAIPVSTASGLMIAYLVVGGAVVEKAFALNGLGAYLVDSVSRNDFPVVQAIALILVLAFLVVNLVVDLLYARLDPRIALS